jgi:hypothetical protein
MARSVTSPLLLHFYTGNVAHHFHGWEIGAIKVSVFCPFALSWLSFGWILWKPVSREAELWWKTDLGSVREGRSVAEKGKVCGSGGVRVASLWEKEGAGLRVLKNGDGEESPSLALGVGEKEREMGLVCWLGLEDERKTDRGREAGWWTVVLSWLQGRATVRERKRVRGCLRLIWVYGGGSVLLRQ